MASTAPRQLRVPSSTLGADPATTDAHNVPPQALGLETAAGHHERAVRLGKQEEKDGGGCLSAVAGVHGCMVGKKEEEARATAARLPPVLPKRGNVGERKWYLQIWLGI